MAIKSLLRFRSASGGSDSADLHLSNTMDALERTLDGRSQPHRGETATAVREARLAFDQWSTTCGVSERLRFNAPRLNELVATIANQRETIESWESAAQFYLATVAGRREWPEGISGDALTAARNLRQVLRYPDERLDSSFPFDRGTPSRVTSEELQELIRALGHWPNM